jgi:hypothetical protein
MGYTVRCNGVSIPSERVEGDCPDKVEHMKNSAQSVLSRSDVQSKKVKSVKPKAVQKALRPALAEGQIWKMTTSYIQIIELGKLLIHYKMMKELSQTRVRTQMIGMTTLETYLKTNRAKLMETPVCS